MKVNFTEVGLTEKLAICSDGQEVVERFEKIFKDYEENGITRSILSE